MCIHGIQGGCGPDMPEFVLAHDIGTSALKSAIVDSSGRVQSSVSRKYHSGTRHSTNGEATQDPLDWWSASCENTKDLAAGNPDLARKICSIGISGHMLGLLPLDRAGNVLHPHMLHSDIRSREQEKRIRSEIGREAVYQITGNLLDARSPLCKLLWLKDHLPETYALTHTLLQSKDYLAYRLTNHIFTDLSDGVHAQFVDINRRDYALDLFRDLGLDPGKLPELHPSVGSCGGVTPEAAASLGIPAGIPVFAAGDGISASLGAGAQAPGDAYLCFGTTAWIARMSETPHFDNALRLFNLINADGRTFGVYGTTQCAGRSVEWAMELFNCSSYGEFNDLAGRAGEDVPIFLPYLEGERTPWFDADARGVFFGCTGRHGRGEMLRGVAEGIALSLRDVTEVFREWQPLHSVKLVGGGGRSDLLTNLISNAAELDIRFCETSPDNSTSLGAALLAFTGSGIFRDLAQAAGTVKSHLSVQPDAGSVEIYRRKYAVYRSLYPALKPIWFTGA